MSGGEILGKVLICAGEVDHFEQRPQSQICESEDRLSYGPDLKLALDIMRSHFFTFDAYINTAEPTVMDWIALAFSPTGMSPFVVLLSL